MVFQFVLSANIVLRVIHIFLFFSFLVCLSVSFGFALYVVVVFCFVSFVLITAMMVYRCMFCFVVFRLHDSVAELVLRTRARGCT